MMPLKYSFKLLSRAKIKKIRFASKSKKGNPIVLKFKKDSEKKENLEADKKKRLFLKLAGVVGLGAFASLFFPRKAEALVFGSTPASNVVGIKDAGNARINPATDESLQSLASGQEVNKFTASLSSSGNVLTPSSGKKLRIYATRFSLSADLTSVSFRFTSGGTDHEKFLAPKTGGLYGSNSHPNYVEGGVNEVLYAVIDGTGTIQVNIDYLEA